MHLNPDLIGLHPVGPFCKHLRTLAYNYNRFGGNDDLALALNDAATLIENYGSLSELTSILLHLLDITDEIL